MELDEMFRLIGHFGRFQAFYFSVLLIPVLLSGLRFTEYIFTTMVIPHRCRIPECEGTRSVELSPPWLPDAVPLSPPDDPPPCLRYRPRTWADLNSSSDSCSLGMFQRNVTETCDQWVFEEPAITIANSFNILCPSEYWKLTTLSSVSVFTSLAGQPISGFLGDRFGRKRVLVWGCTLVSVFGLIRSFSPSYTVSLVLEGVDGLFTSSIYSSAFILGLEMLSPSKRLLGSMLISSYYTMGEIVLAVVAWLVQDWRVMLRLIYTPMVLTVALHWILPESVLWLYTQDRIVEVERIFCKIAKVNGTEDQLPTVLAALKASQVSDENSEAKSISKPPAKSLRIMAALKSPIILWRVVVTALCWVASVFLYYGISQNAALLAGNHYLSFVLVSLVELPAYIVSLWLPDWPPFGRRGSTAAAFFLGAVACLAFLITTPAQTDLNLVLFLVGKFSSTLAITVVYIYTAEVFPTELRNSLLCLCSMTGALGSILSQQTPLIRMYVNPMIIFGVVSLIGGVLALTYAETLGIKLPDTIQESEDIGKKKEQEIQN